MITPSELNYCYRVLELKPGASLELVDQAYKDLAFIWHPDRIPEENERLRQRAQEKLKEINYARDQLRSLLRRSSNSHSRPPRYSNPRSAATPPASKPPASKPPASYSPIPQPQYPSQSSSPTTTYKSPTAPQNSQRPPVPSASAYPQRRSYQRPSAQPDMTGANLRGANLKEKDLSGRNLSGADLTQANLSDAFLHGVNLNGACLYRANLFRANFLQADLRYANLQESNLIGADLSGADLRGANLTGANVGTGDRIMVKLTGAILAGAILPDGSVHPQ